jgi:hypothetical protein
MARRLRAVLGLCQIGVLMSIRPYPIPRASASLRMHGSGLGLAAASFAGAVERRRLFKDFADGGAERRAHIRSCWIGMKPGAGVNQPPVAVSYFFMPASREGLVDRALIPSLVRSKMPGQTKNDTALYYFIRTVNACNEVRRETVVAANGQQHARPIIDRDLIPSLARFRMPRRTVEGDGMNFERQNRAAHTEAVAASLRSQHRGRSIIQACSPIGPRIKSNSVAQQVCEYDETHDDFERNCCVCQERFESETQASGGTLRVQLLTCQHVFCVSCVARVLTHQGIPCSSAGSCSTCALTELRPQPLSLSNTTPSSSRSVCKGWAPCPLCRRLYSQDQVSLLQTHATSKVGGDGGGITASAVADAVKYALAFVAAGSATGTVASATAAFTITSAAACYVTTRVDTGPRPEPR